MRKLVGFYFALFFIPLVPVLAQEKPSALGFTFGMSQGSALEKIKKKGLKVDKLKSGEIDFSGSIAEAPSAHTAKKLETVLSFSDGQLARVSLFYLTDGEMQGEIVYRELDAFLETQYGGADREKKGRRLWTQGDLSILIKRNKPNIVSLVYAYKPLSQDLWEESN